MPKKRKREELVAALRAAGCDDPEGWADSELEENIPQFARFLLCKSIWESAMEPWRRENVLESYPETEKLLAAGVDPQLLRRLAGKIAYDTMTEIVNTIDEGSYIGDANVADDAPGWTLVEVDGATLKPTSRHAGFIHESIPSVDPSGTEGQEFRER